MSNSTIRAAYEILMGCLQSDAIAKQLDVPTVERIAKRLNDMLPGATDTPNSGTVSVSRELLSAVHTDLENYLSRDLCECEYGHICGRTDIEKHRDELRAVLAQPTKSPCSACGGTGRLQEPGNPKGDCSACSAQPAVAHPPATGHAIPQWLRDQFDAIELAVMRGNSAAATFTDMRTKVQAYFEMVRSDPRPHDRRSDLRAWFGLSYAAWLTLPRVFMEAMPSEWQARMAVLLHEYSDAIVNAPAGGTTVRVTDAEGRLEKAPDWLLNYRYPNRAMLDHVFGRVAAAPTLTPVQAPEPPPISDDWNCPNNNGQTHDRKGPSDAFGNLVCSCGWNSELPF